MHNKRVALISAGQAMYGDRWQTDLARDLGLSDARRIRQWVTGDRPIPDGVMVDIKNLLKERKANIDAVLSNTVLSNTVLENTVNKMLYAVRNDYSFRESEAFYFKDKLAAELFYKSMVLIYQQLASSKHIGQVYPIYLYEKEVTISEFNGAIQDRVILFSDEGWQMIEQYEKAHDA